MMFFLFGSVLKVQASTPWYPSSIAQASYFSPTVSAIDRHERGEAGTAPAPLTYPEETTLQVEEDEEGWCRALLSYCVPLAVPASRLPADQKDQVAKKALRSLDSQLSAHFEGVERAIPGVKCHLDCSTFGLDLSISERDFLQGQRRETGKAPTSADKDEMRLEKKLREILALKRRSQDGEKLEKLQAEKVAKRSELFQEVADLKLRRAEKDLVRLFKKQQKTFQDAFWDLEFQAQNNAGATEDEAFGVFDEEGCEGPVRLTEERCAAECAAPRWAAAPLLLELEDGQVAAFAVEILQGLVRLGWARPKACLADLGADKGGYGFGGTGKKVTGGVFEPYGQNFGVGDTIHCEAERENGRLRIGFAKNAEPLGVAYEVKDADRTQGIRGVVAGKNFKVRLVSAERMPLEEAPEPVLENFEHYDPPRLAQAVCDFQAGDEENLLLWTGETVYVSDNDGEGWLYGFFLDPEDPDDGGWFPADAVAFLDAEGRYLSPAEEEAPAVEPEQAPREEEWPPPAAEAAVWEVEEPELPQWREPTAWAEPGGEPEEEECPVPGLQEWLQGLSLHHYGPLAAEWCVEMGAVSIEEIKESWEDFAEGLALKPLEKKRLQKACC
ncbi:unnamed protein product [Effrenium voratum]|nr:unnamed protein product [Effrenium voratum]